MSLVTGATGLIGRALICRLHEAGAQVRALSRDPEQADLPPDVEVAGGDLGDSASLEAAMNGADRVYLFSAGRAGPGFAAAAQRAKVGEVVLVSGLDREPVTLEEPLNRAGVAWSHLRPTAFSANALRHWGHSIRKDGTVRAPYGESSIAPIHEADVADVAAALLLDGDFDRERYELTGPQSLTFREQAAQIGRAIGRDIRFIEETPQQYRERMIRFVPAPIVDGMLSAWAGTLGTSATVTNVVENLTGHRPRTFARWADEHADDFGKC